MGSAPAAPVIIPAIAPDGTLYPVEKLQAHAQSLLHLAVSVFVFDRGELLIQQRAAGKYHCGGQWANTCCSHPDWGESLADCASRRLFEEMGIAVPLEACGELEYTADVGNGLCENERVTLFRAEVPRSTLKLLPDPAEVMASRWIQQSRLRAEITSAPQRFAPWFRIYVEQYGEMIFPH